MNILISIATNLFKIINSLIPKSTLKVMFISRPDFSDNTLHMYRYMQQNSKKQLSWLVYDREIYNILISNGYKNIFYIKSIKGIYEYCRSKYIITSSSSLWQIKSPFQKQFDLWHGIPLKNVLCMGEKNIKAKRQAPNITMRFATSSLEKALLSASFDFNAMKIEITGQPRTDALFSKKDYLSKYIDEDISKYSKIVIYMPTYRSGYRNKKEGNKFDSTNIFRLEEYDHDKFINYLEKNNILFLLKLHPYEEALYSKIDMGNNIRWITNKELVKKSLSIYDLLPQTDILITDYSSIYFDYLLLDKKIIFMPIDLEYYENNRGFELEPYEFWTPGVKVFTQRDLEDELLNSDTEQWQERRKIVRDILHTHKDNSSSKRVVDSISKKHRDFNE